MLIEIVLGSLAVVFFLWLLCKKPSGLPPGRWGLPLIGYIPTKSKYIDDHLSDFQEKYGDMYIWRVGTQILMFIHDYNIVRQIFGSQDFMNRPDWDIFKFNEKVALGVAFSNNDIWHSNRKFTFRQLRDLGMGKSSFSMAVQNQAQKLVEALKEDAGRPGPIPAALNTAIVNVIWKMVADRQFEKDDPQLLEFKRLLEGLASSGGAIIIADIFPWVKKILPNFIIRKLFKLDFYDEAVNKFMEYFRKLIQEHRETLDPDDPKDLMDSYLIEMDLQEGAGDKESYRRSEKDLTTLIFDLFVGGSDTTISSLKWIFLYMAAYPEVQEKLQQEIDQALSKGELPTLEDKGKLQYTEAVINEVLRKSSVASIGLQHTASQDTHLQGCFIPKGTICMAAVDSIHHDPRYWEKPDRFLPGRWLDEEGKFVMKKEGFLPFSVGKRNCIGESLARLNLLVVTTAVFQNFTVTPPPGIMADLRYDPINPLGHDPNKQDVIFSLREK